MWKQQQQQQQQQQQRQRQQRQQQQQQQQNMGQANSTSVREHGKITREAYNIPCVYRCLTTTVDTDR